MGPDLKLTEKSEAKLKVVSRNERKRSLAQDQKDKRVLGNMDIDVDIAECMNHGELEAIDVQCQDATEFSSSFGDTVSGDDNGSVVNDDLEVESPLNDTRKRRLTDHWMRFIQPLRWRCKWLEVKLHDFKSQALKYERELAKYGQSEQLEFEKVTFQGFDGESLGKEVMKRRERKRVEDTAHVASYMSDHNIFSYYESKKPAIAAAALDDDCSEDNKTINGNDDIGCNDGRPFLQFRDGDNQLEQILRNIEVLQSRIQKLKTQMDKVMAESPQEFSSINILTHLTHSVEPCDILNNSGNHLYPEEGYRNSSHCTTSQHAIECVMWDNVMPGSAVSSHGVVAPVPDMIRSMTRSLLEISSENIEGEILIPNHAAKEELCNFGSAISQQAEKQPEKDQMGLKIRFQ